MKRIFFDTEFTRCGQNTSLVSVGFVSEEGEFLYVELDDYDKSQVTPWLQENILCLLNSTPVNSCGAAELIVNWFNKISGNEQIQLVCCGKELDTILLFNLFAKAGNGSTLRSWLGRLPSQIDHRRHLDLDTIFTIHDLDPAMDREKFSEVEIPGKRHHALKDAMIIRECWKKIQSYGWVK